MVVRGAPAIGVAAAYGVALEALAKQNESAGIFEKDVEYAFELLADSRPTAVNLFWAIKRMKKHWHGIESKLLSIRHSTEIDVATNNHSSLKQSHTCVNVMQATGPAGNFREVIKQLKNTSDVDKVVFISAPLRDQGCC